MNDYELALLKKISESLDEIKYISRESQHLMISNSNSNTDINLKIREYELQLLKERQPHVYGS